MHRRSDPFCRCVDGLSSICPAEGRAREAAEVRTVALERIERDLPARHRARCVGAKSRGAHV